MGLRFDPSLCIRSVINLFCYVIDFTFKKNQFLTRLEWQMLAHLLCQSANVLVVIYGSLMVSINNTSMSHDNTEYRLDVPDFVRGERPLAFLSQFN